MPRVLICDPLDANGLKLLEAAGIEIDNRPKLKGADLQQALRDADGAIVRSGTTITAAELERPGKLRAIARAGVGVDNIDVAAATRKGIVVMNTPGGNTVSAAEHTIALLMSMSRRIPAADASMKAGKWERGTTFLGTQLTGKTIGVVGLGRIGREVAARAIGLQMKVVGYDPFLTPERAAQLGIESAASIDAMLPSCDFLTIHVPLSDDTKSLINARELAMLPKHARVLNVARGGIINEAALADALKAGTIAGAAVDVFDQEPPLAGHPLGGAPNIVLTPHIGASTVEAQDAVAREAAQLLIDFLTKGVVQFAVNMAAVDRTELEEMRHYVDLARRLGLLHAQVATGPIERAEVTYRGDLTRRSTKLLTAAFAAGLLEKGLSEQVNVVNATLFAQERGIEIVESTNPKQGDFANLMQIEVTSGGQKYTVAGTMFGSQYLRLVQLGPFRLDSFLEGTMMMFLHQDVPGLIGYIGTIFGKHGVNIAQMTVGRKLQVPGGDAVAVLNLDSTPPAEAVQEVIDHPKISQVQVVNLPPVGEMPAWFG